MEIVPIPFDPFYKSGIIFVPSFPKLLYSEWRAFSSRLNLSQDVIPRSSFPDNASRHNHESSSPVKPPPSYSKKDLGLSFPKAGSNPGSPFSIALLYPSLFPTRSKNLTTFGYSSNPIGMNKRIVVKLNTVITSAAVKCSPASQS